MPEALIPNSELPAIPSKRYFTIGEVSELCCVKSHVLRYWEQEFPSLKPMKRRGNRRYYQLEDVVLIRQIRGLLYEQGYTISGARQQIMGGGAVSEEGKTTTATTVDDSVMKQLIDDLEQTLKLLRS
ncbi:MAG: Transcriptional regulator, MerR family [uncultured Thiotrichaceae bacterium]|uniref:Transcriptional regulator, MerR family n=1 Tax=uncultured Thiotrichaceae bacterium TaxID=298394 RepID=A0A6S6U9P8_9GAMM|nr:MAG: Transcriptional regulator, MerR family [uncultured Thiotrichaceae bacterium]